MTRKSARVVALMPMTSAAAVLDLKFDTLMEAARSGRLRVTTGSRKPAGRFVQPLVSVRQLRLYAKWQEQAWRKSGVPLLIEAAKKIARAKFPPETEPLDRVLRARPFMWGGTRNGAASHA